MYRDNNDTHLNGTGGQGYSLLVKQIKFGCVVSYKIPSSTGKEMAWDILNMFENQLYIITIGCMQQNPRVQIDAELSC